MIEYLLQNPYFGVWLTICGYLLGNVIKKRFKSPLCNAMVIAVAFIIVVLVVFDISYDTYFQGATIINSLLVPATACLGMNIYLQWEFLRKNLVPVIVGCTVGTIASVGSIYVLCVLFSMDRVMTISLLPKAVTAAISTPIADGYGGISAITAMAVTVTGIGGNLVVPYLAKLFRVKDPLAEGLAIGTCSHGMGTARALQIGEIQGAMSGLAMGLCGVVTAIIALSFPLIP